MDRKFIFVFIQIISISRALSGLLFVTIALTYNKFIIIRLITLPIKCFLIANLTFHHKLKLEENCLERKSLFKLILIQDFISIS